MVCKGAVPPLTLPSIKEQLVQPRVPAFDGKGLEFGTPSQESTKIKQTVLLTHSNNLWTSTYQRHAVARKTWDIGVQMVDHSNIDRLCDTPNRTNSLD